VIIQAQEQKLVTGPVVNGDIMKLFEVDAELTKKIKWDLGEDAIVYMRNEPMFYRKEYFPTMTSIADRHRAGQEYDMKEMMRPMLERGITAYCKKYKLAGMPDDIFAESDREGMLEKLFKEEIEQIKKGEYQ
jgi:hypothetical protein